MELNRNELTYLGSRNTPSNPLSPLKRERAGDPNEGERSLRARKILVDGQLNDWASSWFDTLADPERSGRVAIREGDVLIEKIGYRKEKMYVLVENRGEELDLSAPDHLKETMLSLSQITGMSRVIAYDIEMELTPWDTLVYLGLLDLYRKTAMLGLWHEPAPDLTRETLDAHLHDPLPGSLVSMFLRFSGFSVPRLEDLVGILRNLEEQGVVKMEGPRLRGDHGRLGMEFLVPRAVTTLEVYNVQGDRVAGNESLVISAGLNEHLLIAFGTEGITLSLISGSYLLKRIEGVLYAPALDM